MSRSIVIASESDIKKILDKPEEFNCIVIEDESCAFTTTEFDKVVLTLNEVETVFEIQKKKFYKLFKNDTIRIALEKMLFSEMKQINFITNAHRMFKNNMEQYMTQVGIEDHLLHNKIAHLLHFGLNLHYIGGKIYTECEFISQFKPDNGNSETKIPLLKETRLMFNSKIHIY